MKLTLSRGLRYKKRVIEQIRKIETDIQLSNCIVAGEERILPNVKDALNKRNKLVNHLISLKLNLQNATAPIQPLIFQLAEAKSEIAFLNKIATNHGTVKARYREDQPLTYESEIKKQDKDALIFELQNKIDNIQTDIDAHNNKTIIEVEDVNL